MDHNEKPKHHHQESDLHHEKHKHHQGESPLEHLAHHSTNIDRRSLTILGALLIVLGVITLTMPVYSSLAVTIIVGMSTLLSGAAFIANAFFNKKWSGFIGSILLGAVGVLGGGLILAHPYLGVATLTLMLAGLLIAQGVARLVLSSHLGRSQGRFWVILNGIITIALGIFIWYEWPETSAWVIGLFVGIDLLLAGWSMIFLSTEVPNKK